MAEYIKAAVCGIEKALKEILPGLLEARGLEDIAEWGRADTQIMVNSPKVWVTPGANEISDEGQGLSQVAGVLIIIGITGAEPDALVNAAMEYVAAVTDAIESVGSWTANIRHVHPGHQDYSARFKRGEGFAIFPVVTLTVEMTEPPVAIS